MIAKILIGISIGACVGAVVGYFGRCSTGTCPLTSNPYRGAIWGGVMGLLVTLASCSPPREKENLEQGKIESEAVPSPENEKPSGEKGGLERTEDETSQKGEILHIGSESDFKKLVLEGNRVSLVDFHATWCAPCHTLAPTISALAKKYAGRVAVCKIDVDEVQSVARQYGIRSIPTVLFIKNGKEMDRLIGLGEDDEYFARLDRLLSAGGAPD